ncbi:MAG: type II toxin-antitoxin system RelE/ParE family toxin [Rhizorhabdus sp.]|nr:type II toxin-antitoxin system RelE/ParE family toxin [Rhizorhabdus sp.]
MVTYCVTIAKNLNCRDGAVEAWTGGNDRRRRLNKPFPVDLPPANRVEQLAGDRAGQHSIRINYQYRICFCWSQTEGACDIEVVKRR